MEYLPGIRLKYEKNRKSFTIEDESGNWGLYLRLDSLIGIEKDTTCDGKTHAIEFLTASGHYPAPYVYTDEQVRRIISFIECSRLDDTSLSEELFVNAIDC